MCLHPLRGTHSYSTHFPQHLLHIFSHQCSCLVPPPPLRGPEALRPSFHSYPEYSRANSHPWSPSPLEAVPSRTRSLQRRRFRVSQSTSLKAGLWSSTSLWGYNPMWKVTPVILHGDTGGYNPIYDDWSAFTHGFVSPESRSVEEFEGGLVELLNPGANRWFLR